MADTCDALGGAHEADRVLEILKDSRVGTFGALALTLSVLLRVGVLAELGGRAVPALVLAHVLARMAPVGLMAWLPYATAAPKSSALARGGRAPQVLLAAVWAAAGCAVALGLGGERLGIAASVAIACGVALSLGLWFRRRLGGITGDFLGATEQAVEAVVLLTALGVGGQA